MNTPNEYDGVTKNSIIKVNVSQGVIEEEKIVNINTNTQTVIEPDEGYDAIEKITVNTNIPNETTTLVAVSNGNYNPVSPYIGYNSVSVNVPNQVTSLIVNNNGIYTPVSPYIGYSSVSVNVPQIQNEYLQNKRITSNGDYTIQGLMNYPQNYDGLTKNSNIIVDISTPDITQISNYSITHNGIQTIPIPSGYDAVDSISVNVECKPSIQYVASSIRNLTIYRNNSGATKTLDDISGQDIYLFYYNSNNTAIIVEVFVDYSQYSMNIPNGYMYAVEDNPYNFGDGDIIFKESRYTDAIIFNFKYYYPKVDNTRDYRFNINLNYFRWEVTTTSMP